MSRLSFRIVYQAILAYQSCPKAGAKRRLCTAFRRLDNIVVRVQSQQLLTFSIIGYHWLVTNFFILLSPVFSRLLSFFVGELSSCCINVSHLFSVVGNWTVSFERTVRIPELNFTALSSKHRVLIVMWRMYPVNKCCQTCCQCERYHAAMVILLQ